MINYKNSVVAADVEQIVSDVDVLSRLAGACVLVTGATGMLATYVIYTLAHLRKERGVELSILALGRSKEKMESRFGELIAEEVVIPIFQDVCLPLQVECKVDYIIHLAGAASPTAILSDPVGIIRANTEGLMSIMELARKSSAKVVFASSREVYGAVAEGVTLLSEDAVGVIDPMDSRSCYPESKRMAETICKSYYQQYSVESVVLRIAHSYGPGMNLDGDGRVMSDLISDVVAGRNIELKSAGGAVRAFCYIADAVRALLLTMVESRGCEVYNLANEEEPISILELAELLVLSFSELGLMVTHREATEAEACGYAKFERVALDTTKLKSIGWTPQVSLAEGVKRTVKSYML